MPDTIAAIATPQLPSAIGILRLSGPDTRRILDVVFSPAHGGLVSGQAPRRMVLGDLHDRQGRIIDSALAVLFPGPHSYTGEDCAEIHCHGSPVVLNEGLDALFAQGARQAKGGEFTQRAFLNGRMDLIQAEAVADLIDAESPAAAHNAVGQLEGRLSRGVGEIYDGLMEVVSRFYAVVDYPDEDIDPLTQGQLTQTIARSETALEALLATFRRGQLLRQGVPAVILGKPNAGKSSLLNALLGYDRAIVTDVAGTTRDTVEEKVQVGHVLLRLCDTAGLRDTGDAVERLGVQRTRDAARQAALALLVLDGSRRRTRTPSPPPPPSPGSWSSSTRRTSPPGWNRRRWCSASGRSIPCPPPRERAWTPCAGPWRPCTPPESRLRASFSPTPGRLTPWPAVWRLSAPPAGRWRTA